MPILHKRPLALYLEGITLNFNPVEIRLRAQAAVAFDAGGERRQGYCELVRFAAADAGVGVRRCAGREEGGRGHFGDEGIGGLG